MHLKRQGQYICRTLSYHGCSFSVDEHSLDAEALRTYDEAALFWIQLFQQLQDNIKIGDLKYFDRRPVPGGVIRNGTGSNKSTPPKRGKHSARTSTNNTTTNTNSRATTKKTRKTRKARYGPPTSDDTGSDSGSSIDSSVIGSSSGDSSEGSGDSDGNSLDDDESSDEEHFSGSLMLPANDGAAIRSINRYFWGECCVLHTVLSDICSMFYF